MQVLPESYCESTYWLAVIGNSTAQKPHQVWAKAWTACLLALQKNGHTAAIGINMKAYCTVVPILSQCMCLCSAILP